MDEPDPPPPPNAAQIAAEQAKYNKDAAISQQYLNSTNQVTPYGNLTYEQLGTWGDGTPRFQATQTLSPTQQQLYNQYTSNQIGLGKLGGMQIDKITSLLGTPFDLNSALSTQQTDMQRKLLDPIWNAREEQLRTRLANQGIAAGGEAYSNAYRDFGDERDRAYAQMLLAGRGQAAQEALSQRNQPINEITALQSGSQVSQPNFVGTPTASVAPTNVLGAYQLQTDAQNNAYNQQMASNNAIYGALGSIGGAALGGWASGGFKPPKWT